MYQSVPILTGNPDLFVICLHYHLLPFSSIFQEVLKGENVDEKVKNTLTFLFINLCFSKNICWPICRDDHNKC